MASLIPGFEYDIFISYRQKDNKGDRWVSEFVEALKTELESTFKEEISVYFDINPHDGLLETHDVDASLKDKLKCLVFIPIISRTYCDPKSFAWEQEFKAYVEQALKDQFGLKVKLPNGNVATRVLPVRIYELDSADIKLFESVLGGVLRGVEFIYSEPGVNRPLKPDDDEKINLNKTRYRNQINKVGNAIKEIIGGLKTEPATPVKGEIQQEELLEQVSLEEKSGGQGTVLMKLSMRIVLSGIVIIVILIVAGIFAYPKIFKQDGLVYLRSKDRISVAVMPFQNRTSDVTWKDSQEIIQDIIKNSLSNSEVLEVRGTESIDLIMQSQGLTNNASLTPSLAKAISKKLDVNVFIYGSINQANEDILLQAELADSKTGTIFKSFHIDGKAKEDNAISFGKSLSDEIHNFLAISKLEKEVPQDVLYLGSTMSPLAYRYFFMGENAFTKQDFPSAIEMYSKAFDIDSNFYFAALEIAISYGNQGLWDSARVWCLKGYKGKNQMSPLGKIWADIKYAQCFETPKERIKYLNQFLQIDNQQPLMYYMKGLYFSELNQFDNAIPEYEASLKIYNKWGSKPFWAGNYTLLGRAYHKTGQYRKEKKIYKKAERDFPDDHDLIYSQAILSLTEGNTEAANKYIEKYKLIRKESSSAESDVTISLAEIYSEAGLLEKAEQYYRQTLSFAELTYDNSRYFNNFAMFLINKDLNIREGITLADKVLKLSPDNYSFLDTKGWGLYKQGKYKEAMDILQKSWDLRMKNAKYDHEAFLHLEAAKKAVADQKNY